MALALREISDNSELEFIQYLVWLEGKPLLWESQRYRTYGSYLTATGVCDVKRYNLGKKALTVHGVRVRAVGMFPAEEALRLEHAPAAMQQAMDEFEDFKIKNGVYMSAATAARTVKDLGASVGEFPAHNNKPTVVQRLHAQKDQLLKQNEALLRQNAQLRERITLLEGLLRKNKVRMPATQFAPI